MANDSPPQRRTPQEEKSEPYNDARTSSLQAFCAYATADSKYADRMQLSLALLLRQKLISTWSQAALMPGDAVLNALFEHLNSAELVFLLLSPDFFASDACYAQLELAVANHLAGRQLVVPVVIRPCDWRSSPLGNLHALPYDDSLRVVPISQWTDPDSAWQSVTDNIRRLIALRWNPIRETRTFPEGVYRPEWVYRPFFSMPPATQEQEALGRWSFVISGTVEGRQRGVVTGIVDYLRGVARDERLTLLRLEDGSLRFVLRGTKQGYERVHGSHLKSEFSRLSIEVLEVSWEADIQHTGLAREFTVLFAKEDPYRFLEDAYRSLEREARLAAFREKALKDDLAFLRILRLFLQMQSRNEHADVQGLNFGDLQRQLDVLLEQTTKTRGRDE
jgi:hypothetical protein